MHYLKDPRTKKFNFTPYLENITQPVDFDYDALAPYITSSRDNVRAKKKGTVLCTIINFI